MEFKIFTENDKNLYEKDIIEMLSSADKDFVPPLSQRASTLDKSFFGQSSNGSGIQSYYREMKNQDILGVFIEEKLVGFVSYRRDFVNDIITETELPNIYVSTLLVGKEARGMGLTKKMYSYLFFDLYPERNIFTRTWSTNFSHTKILSFFGFSETLRKENDRGAGIDTVYYKRAREKELALV